MNTDLFKAAYANDTKALQKALGAGADPNQQHPHAGTLPLQLACQANAIEAIKVLLAAGARADITYTRTSRVDGRVFANHTPLMYADSVEAATLLLDAGAKLEPADERGWTALVCAANSGNVALTTLLLDRGADVAVRPAFGGSRLNLCEFLDALMALPRQRTEASQARIAALKAVQHLIASRTST